MIKKSLLGATMALLCLPANANTFSVVQKDGFVELDCHRPTPVQENAHTSCVIHNRAIVSQDGKEGLIYPDGTPLTAIVYDDIDTLSPHITQVKQGDKYGLISLTTGFEITPIIYDEMGLFAKNRLPVRLGDNWGYLDEMGKQIIAPRYGNAYRFENNGLAIVTNHGYAKDDTYRMGVIDVDGNEILAPIYRTIFVADNHIIFQNEQGHEGIADLKGNVIVSPQYTNIGGFFDGFAVFSLLNFNDMVGYLDTDGNEVIEPQYTGFKHHGRMAGKTVFTAAKHTRNAKRWGVIDAQNRTLVDFKYLDLEPYFDESLFIATDDTHKKTLLNLNGKPISGKYDNIGGFAHGVSTYQKGHKYGLLSPHGKEITPAIYDDIKSEYSHDNAKLYGYQVKVEGKIGFLNTKNKLVLAMIYDDIMNFGNGVLYLKQGKQYGVAKTDGKLITPVIYDDFRPLANGYSKAKIDETWYLISPQGERLGVTSNPKSYD